MVGAGISVMGHLGLTPQSLGQLSGFRVQGKSRAACDGIVRDALALQDAGAFSILLEAMPAEASAYVRAHLRVPVYGIGAGPNVDGQLLISNDLLGNFVGDISPRFAARYAEVGAVVERAFSDYARDVRDGVFPRPEHWYPADSEAERELREARAEIEQLSASLSSTRDFARTGAGELS
jgi:3-methyl-2-oxobutanoate hydroxymethyltransferase